METTEKTISFDEKRRIVLQKFDELIKFCPQLQKPVSYARVKNAYEFADKAHKGQFRKTGLKLPFIVHPIAVATIVAGEMGFGSTTVAAALLHDVVEDTDYTVENIRTVFGNDVAFIVEGLTKITRVFNPERTEQAETFMHLILKMSEDKRIAFIKIADRLHNLRTMDGIRESSQMIKTAESLDVYAPLAHQLGLFEIKKEIEDISFRLRQKEDYEKIKKLVGQNQKNREIIFKLLSDPISEALNKMNYNFTVEPITKSLYKTWEVIKKKKIELNEIHNFLSVRIIFKPNKIFTEKQQCYSLYAILTDLFAVKENKLIDRITNPKTNGFQALITSVMLGGNWVEVQIMTERMNLIAKRGYAKNHKNLHLHNIEQWGRSLKTIFDTQELTSREIIELVKPQDREIHVFTPKGDLITLPKGATALDFAFRIHTDLGLKFIAAQIDRKIVGYDYKLTNAERIKIIASNSINPQKEWAEALVCSRNKAELRKYFNKEKNKIILKGEKIFKNIIKNLNSDESKMSKLISLFDSKNKNDFYYKIATKSILISDIKKIIKTNQPERENASTTPFKNDEIEIEDKHSEETNKTNFNPKKSFVVDNIDNVVLAPCCHPIEGDLSMIYHSSDSELIIHRRDCAKARELNSSEGKNTTVAKWNLLGTNTFRTKIKFRGTDRKALLIDILRIISEEMSINMIAIVVKSTKNVFRGTIELLVQDSKSLQNLIGNIKNIKEISKVYRVLYK